MNCWWCGVEPRYTLVTSDLGYFLHRVAQWPPGDHVHAAVPPTPDQLTEAGREALRRLLEVWDDRPASGNGVHATARFPAVAVVAVVVVVAVTVTTCRGGSGSAAATRVRTGPP